MLLRLVVEQVRVIGWNVEIRLRIPLDDELEGTPPPDPPAPNNDNPSPLSSEDRLRSLGGPQGRQFPTRRPRPRPCANIHDRRTMTPKVVKIRLPNLVSFRLPLTDDGRVGQNPQ